MMVSMSIDCMATQMQIGLEVSQIEKAGGCYSLGSTMISWFSKKQSSVALSTAEAEYLVAYSTSCEAIWI